MEVPAAELLEGRQEAGAAGADAGDEGGGGEAVVVSEDHILGLEQSGVGPVAGGLVFLVGGIQPPRLHAGRAQGDQPQLLLHQLPRRGWLRPCPQGVCRRQGPAGVEGPAGGRQAAGLGGQPGPQRVAGEHPN